MDFEAILLQTGEIGFVQQIKSKSLILVEGLPGAHQNELVLFESGQEGVVTGLGERLVEILSLSNEIITPGTRVARTGNPITIPTDQTILGKVIDPLGRDFGTQTAQTYQDKRPIENNPLGIAHRARIVDPLETGVSLVDILIPLGKGQRELIIGDRKTGKSSFLTQTVITQSKKGTVCIYAFIGKKVSEIQQFISTLTANNAMDNVIIIASGANDSPGLVHLAPFTAMTLAEYFRDLGRNTLVVMDDMTTHAKFYREYSLTARKFPGRESYPGNIFYLHSKLLERAGNFKTPKGDVSISAFPVAESFEDDITGYIQTNLMSMVDGHIFFDSDYFVKGRRPAINPFLSVSRVGRQTQSSVRKDVNREISVVLAAFEKSSELAHFGSSLGDTLKLSIDTGEKLWKFLDQPPQTLLSTNLQILIFSLIWLNILPASDKAALSANIQKIIKAYQDNENLSKQLDDWIAKATSYNGFLAVFQEKINELKVQLKI